MRSVCPICHEVITYLDVEYSGTAEGVYDIASGEEDKVIGSEDFDVEGYYCPKCHSAIKPDACDDPDDPDYVKPPCKHEFKTEIPYVGGAKMVRCSICGQNLKLIEADKVLELVAVA